MNDSGLNFYPDSPRIPRPSDPGREAEIMKHCLFVSMMSLALAASAGCIQTGGYDPGTGMIYGPSFRSPFAKDHHAHGVHDCSLCAVEASCQSCNGWSGGMTPGMYYDDGAVYGGGPSYGGCAGNGGCSGCGGGPVMSGCSSCGQPPVVGAHSGCSTCGQAHGYQNNSFGGETYVGEGFVGDSSTGTSFGSGDFHSSHENCPHCQHSHSSNPIFSSETVPGMIDGQSPMPVPAPPADGASESETILSPTPEVPGQVSRGPMMIPTLPTSSTTRQVHWVPSTLK